MFLTEKERPQQDPPHSHTRLRPSTWSPGPEQEARDQGFVCMSLMGALRKQRQEDLCDFQARQNYMVRSYIKKKKKTNRMGI